ncbi:MAG TPA: hypothetical protein VFI11_06795 [Anaerolineales bacterium]|nr:hypothetical protein [Anaerolineales bacterium]
MSRPSWVLIIVGSALVLTAIGAGIAFLPRSATESVALPEDLAGLPRLEAKLGEAAADEVRRLHGDSFSYTSAGYARYGSRGEATLWVLEAASDGRAQDLVEAMTSAIAQGDSPFAPLPQESIDGRTVYPLIGMGQEHMYFRAGRLVVWLAVNREVAEEARRAILETYR